jgi:hypothetical protein
LESFDKYGWMKAVQGDPQFSDREFRLAFVICSQFTRRDGTGWPVELERIAAAMAPGMASNRLREALVKLCNGGYLVETYRRSTGTGLTAQRSHSLIPQPGNTDPVAGHCSETLTPDGTNTDPVQVNTDPVAVNTDPVQGAQTWSDQPKEPPKGTLEGTYKGFSEGTTNGRQGTESFTCSGCERDFSGRPTTPSMMLCFDCTLEILQCEEEMKEKESLEEAK